MNDNLPELRDIHLPDGVSVFPPAYGWYVVIAAILIGCLAIKGYRLWQRKSRKHYALKVLSELDYTEVIPSVAKVSELLRRICVYRYPQAVALSGNKWLDFIQKHGKKKLSEENKNLLLNAPYMKNSTLAYQVKNLDEIVDYIKSWIGENL